MSTLPTAEALGARPVPRGTTGVVSYRTKIETPQNAAEVALGRTLEGMSDDLYRMEDQLDTRRAEEAFTQLRRRKMDLTIGEKEGFANIRGRDAVSRPLMQEYGAKFDDVQKQIADGLSSPRQKERFARRAEIDRLEYDQDLIRHITHQQDVDAKQVLDGTLDIEVQSASLRSGDAQAIAFSREHIIDAVNSYAAHADWGPEQLKAARLNALSQMHAAVLGQQMASGNDRVAKAYFNTKANRDEIEPKVAAQLQNSLNVSSTRGESQRIFDDIIATKDEKDWLASARAVDDDPEVRDQVETRVRQELQLREVARKEVSDQRYLGAANIVDKTGSYLKIPPADWQQMTLHERASLKAYAKQAAGKDRETDPGTFTKFFGMTPQAQAALSDADMMRQYQTKLSESDYQSALLRRQHARDALDKPEKAAKLSTLLSEDEMVAGALREAKLLPANKDARDDMLYRFKIEADKQIQALEAALGKPAQPDQKQKVIDGMVRKKGVVQRGMLGFDSLWPDAEKHISQMTPEERGKAFTPIEKLIPKERAAVLVLARLANPGLVTLTDAALTKRLGNRRIERAHFLAIYGGADGAPATDADMAAVLRVPVINENNDDRQSRIGVPPKDAR